MSWFASLRRDRKLFALVCTLALAFGLLQPLAASASGLDNSWFICTRLAAAEDPAGGGLPSHADRCQLCIAGHVCGFHVAARVPCEPAAAPAPMAVAVPQRLPRDKDARFPRDGDPPPSIRAPPLPV